MTPSPASPAIDRAFHASRSRRARDVTARIEPAPGIVALRRAMLTAGATEGGRAGVSALLDG